MRASCGYVHHHVHDPLERLGRDLLAAVRAVRHADVGEQQAQVVVDLGDGADRRARVRAGGLLLDRDRRRRARRSDRRPASPSARGTGARTPTATRHSGAALRRRSCRRRATTCPTPTGPVMTTSWSRGRSTSMLLRLWTRAPRTAIQSCAMLGLSLGSDATSLPLQEHQGALKQGIVPEGRQPDSSSGGASQALPGSPVTTTVPRSAPPRAAATRHQLAAVHRPAPA